MNKVITGFSIISLIIMAPNFAFAGIMCPLGEVDCGGICFPESVTSCGPSCADCTISGAANTSPTCNAGVCEDSCNTGFADCDANQLNGCETSTTSDASNCGACFLVCSTNNANSLCSNSACVAFCNPGFADCNNNAQVDGCETAGMCQIPSGNSIGGEIIPIESTSLLLAGAQPFSWMIPFLVSVVGIGIAVFTLRKEQII